MDATNLIESIRPESIDLLSSRDSKLERIQMYLNTPWLACFSSLWLRIHQDTNNTKLLQTRYKRMWRCLSAKFNKTSRLLFRTKLRRIRAEYPSGHHLSNFWIRPVKSKTRRSSHTPQKPTQSQYRRESQPRIQRRQPIVFKKRCSRNPQRFHHRAMLLHW